MSIPFRKIFIFFS